jgi:hypothetical protein
MHMKNDNGSYTWLRNSVHVLYKMSNCYYNLYYYTPQMNHTSFDLVINVNF